ncbi:MAG: glucose 1-dehydrogenase [Spirochaetales bacterium]|nr:glucose 1-dehydrogenase [Spirochaetales bacterium]
MSLGKLLSLEDRVAIVTGASRGLGQGFASALAEAGAELVITSRHGGELEQTAEQVRAHGREALEVEADVTREEQVEAMVRRAVERFGRIDVLVNNAASERHNLPPEETPLESWSRVMDTNVTGYFLCAREVGKAMIPRKKGKIINVASISGSIINRHFHGGSYDVSKSAVVGLTKALAAEWAPHGINVIALAPGYYGTAPNRRWFDSNPEIHRKVLDLIPLGRLGDIEELAALVAVLASDVSNYMTGSTVVIDGGYTVW